MKTLTHIGTGLVLTFLVSASLRATDFRSSLTFDADYSQGADLVAGTPKEARLAESAVVSAGQLEVPGGSEGGAEYGIALRDYLDVSSSSWGTNTLAGVFVLNSSSAKARQTLFSTGNNDAVPPVYDNHHGMILLANSDSATGGPRFSLCHDWKSIDIGIDDFKPLPGVPYFIAVSWRDNGDENIDFRIYLREIGDAAGADAIYKASTVVRPSLGMSRTDDQIVAIGHRLGSRDVTKKDALNGSVQRFQIHSTFLEDQDGFAKLFDSVAASLP
ncbi:MAG TPA: hypothetical protein PLS03_10470 [Terrimicrobiaceae bacterium]|nr:hypothetical protein [Terrimicrobiaceae bacterium]